MAKIALARSPSRLSSTGSPSPGGAPRTTASTTPPRLSPSFSAWLTASCMAAILFISGQKNSFRREALISCGEALPAFTPPNSLVQAKISIPASANNFLATAPAITNPAVLRPENLPPPRWSEKPPYLIKDAQSACPGRGTSSFSP